MRYNCCMKSFVATAFSMLREHISTQVHYSYYTSILVHIYHHAVIPLQSLSPVGRSVTIYSCQLLVTIQARRHSIYPRVLLSPDFRRSERSSQLQIDSSYRQKANGRRGRRGSQIGQDHSNLYQRPMFCRRTGWQEIAHQHRSIDMRTRYSRWLVRNPTLAHTVCISEHFDNWQRFCRM
jgi:hypothetical protein